MSSCFKSDATALADSEFAADTANEQGALASFPHQSRTESWARLRRRFLNDLLDFTARSSKAFLASSS